jgi:hypothetical protein
VISYLGRDAPTAEEESKTADAVGLAVTNLHRGRHTDIWTEFAAAVYSEGYYSSTRSFEQNPSHISGSSCSSLAGITAKLRFKYDILSNSRETENKMSIIPATRTPSFRTRLALYM